jgi:hypothetical protein
MTILILFLGVAVIGCVLISISTEESRQIQTIQDPRIPRDEVRKGGLQ